MFSTTMSFTTTSTTASAHATCISAVPDKHGYVPPDACGSNYLYYPSYTAAMIFTILFVIATVLHGFQAFKYRKRFCWVIIMASGWEMASFVLRAVSTRYQQNQGIFIVSQILLLLAPLWVNAFDYMIFARMVYYYLPEQRILGVRAARLSACFVGLDVISFLIQGVGGSLLSGNPPQVTLMRGIHIYMGGIALQELFIVIFISIVIVFHKRMIALERQGTQMRDWRRLLYTLYATLALITVRIVFRLVEFAAGRRKSNPLPYHEAYLYALDALPMCIATYIVCAIHPGQSLIGPESEFPTLTRAQKKEAKRAKKEKKRAEKDDKAKRQRGDAGFEAFTMRPL